MAKRFPIQDQVAIIGIGRSPYGRNLQGRTLHSLGMEAARRAITDARLTKNDIDGIIGTNEIEFEDLQEGLGIPMATYVQNIGMHYQQSHQLIYASAAVFAGVCETALAVWAARARTGSSAANNQFRNTAARPQGLDSTLEFEHLWGHTIDCDGAFAQRWMMEYGNPREVFGMLAINNRSNAVTNLHALMRTPIDIEDYLDAPVRQEPWGILDVDLPADAGNAVVVTTVRHAKELGVDKRMVLVHCANTGEMDHGTHYHEQAIDYLQLSAWFAMKGTWDRTDLRPKDIDLYYPYDRASFISVLWHEAAGFCGPGEAYDLFRDSWDEKEKRLKLFGRILVNAHGGNLSEARTEIGGAIYDAVSQLRGEAGERQASNAKNALLSCGSLFHDSASILLRSD